MTEHLTIADQAKRRANWVEPDRRAEIVPIQPGHIMQVSPPTPVELSGGGGDEYATPVTRAQGQILRLLPFSIVWLVLSLGLVLLAGWAWPWAFVGFSLLTAITFAVMNRQEFIYSRNGLERHRVDAAVEIRRLELKQQHELRKAALDAYLEIQRRHYGVNDE